MIVVSVAQKMAGYFYQRIGSWLPWQVAERIKVISCVLMSPFVLSTTIYGFGKSFKSFFTDNSYSDEIKALREDLDAQSLELLDTLLSRLLNFPEVSHEMCFIPVPREIFTKRELDDAVEWFKFQRKCIRLWKYDDFYPVSTFFYHNGLKSMPQSRAQI